MADYGISAFYPYLNTWDAGLLGAWGNGLGGWGQSLGGAWGAQDTSGAQPQQSSVGADGVTGQDRRGEGGGAGQPGSPSTPAGGYTGTAGRMAGDIGAAVGNHVGKAVGGGALANAMAASVGAPVGVGTLAGSVLGGLTSPGSLATLGGQIAARSIGISAPTSKLGQFAMAVPGTVLGMVNPVLGLLGAFAAPFGLDALGDAFNARSLEGYRDDAEDAYGYSDGRRAMDVALGDLASEGTPTPDSLTPSTVAGLRAAEQLAESIQSYGASEGGRGRVGGTYGRGFGNIGGPLGGARGVDSGYGENMGGWGGLGIGNPSTYGATGLMSGAQYGSSGRSGYSNVTATSSGGIGRGDAPGTTSLGSSTGEGLGGSRGGGYGSMGTGHD